MHEEVASVTPHLRQWLRGSEMVEAWVTYLIWKPCISCVRGAAVPTTVGAVTYSKINLVSYYTERDALAETSPCPHLLSHCDDDVASSDKKTEEKGVSFLSCDRYGESGVLYRSVGPNWMVKT
jgi:hypothetical protein